MLPISEHSIHKNQNYNQMTHFWQAGLMLLQDADRPSHSLWPQHLVLPEEIEGLTGVADLGLHPGCSKLQIHGSCERKNKKTRNLAETHGELLIWDYRVLLETDMIALILAQKNVEHFLLNASVCLQCLGKKWYLPRVEQRFLAAGDLGLHNVIACTDLFVDNQSCCCFCYQHSGSKEETYENKVEKG